MLKIENLDSYYGESKVIDNLSLQVKKGDITCLIGRNGVGKSTTLKSIMGLVKTPKGKVLLNDKDIIKMKTYDRVKLGIGYLPQGRDIFPQMSVQENLELGLQAIGGKGKVPDYIYDLFPILPKFAKRKGGDLSGGQQQQLAIARALAKNPKILLCDEPTGALDSETGVMVLKLLLKMARDYGKTIVIVTHNQNIARMADVVVRVKNGRIQSCVEQNEPAAADEIHW